jgi:hypothetical protein
LWEWEWKNRQLLTLPPSERFLYCLYRNIMREVPRVLVLYDIDMPIKQARSALRYHFRKNAWIKDGRFVQYRLIDTCS